MALKYMALKYMALKEDERLNVTWGTLKNE